MSSKPDDIVPKETNHGAIGVANRDANSDVHSDAKHQVNSEAHASVSHILIDPASSYALRIETINLFNFIAPPLAYYDLENIYSHEQWHKKQTWLARHLSQSNADVVGFQEVFSPQALATLAHAQGLVHFAVVDEPEVIVDYIFRSPVVALASRHPIVEATQVQANTELALAMGLTTEFSFSRKVLRATVDLPQLGLVDCYVVHFKSMRPGLDGDVSTAFGKLHSGPKLLSMQALGRWASSMQRGAEAALLFHAMLERRQTSGLPMVLMGDFNDSLDSGILGALTTQGAAIHTGDIKNADLGHLSDAAYHAVMAHYELQDAFTLYAANLKVADSVCLPDGAAADAIRQPTHYYGAKGSVLDYILLSSEFDAHHSNSLAAVTHYHTFDDHLVRPNFEQDAYSTDHAPVMVTLSIRD